jgi:Cu+-exporting ATPase
VRSGERIGVDGVIVTGTGSVDEATITGESQAILKEVDSEVLSGTLLTDGYLEVEVTKDYKNSHISRLVSLLEDAMSRKPNIENLANRLSGLFSIIILSLSLITFIGWFILSDGDFNISFITAVSVLIIACPCALALATPIATLIGLNIGTKKGILFKEAKFLETMAKADILAIDKTGTLTEGKPEVVDVERLKEYSKDRLFSLLKLSQHPISKGVLNYIGEFKRVELTEIETLPALGVVAKDGDIEIMGGSINLMRERGVEIPERDIEGSLFYYAENGILKTIFRLEDTLRDDAKDGIAKIKSMGIEVVILSGDNRSAVETIGDEVGIYHRESGLKPLDKLNWIKKRQLEERVVVMVGDGVNDILALGTADIGIAMGSGTDIAMEVGDVVLQQDSIKSLADSFTVSRRTFRLIKQNLGLSLIYNALTIPIAMAGYVIPLVASISMSFSSLIVVLNSIRVKRVS